MKYLFGDTDLAAKRLELISKVFCGTTSRFIKRATSGSFKLCLDLGCGPGYTTRLLKSLIQCNRIVGIDNSEKFIQIAKNLSPDIKYLWHDVTSTPFPVGRPDLIF